MIKKVEAFRAWDGTVHTTHTDALKYEFTKSLEQMFDSQGEPNLTGPQIAIMWKYRDQLAHYFMPNVLENDNG